MRSKLFHVDLTNSLTVSVTPTVSEEIRGSDGNRRTETRQRESPVPPLLEDSCSHSLVRSLAHSIEEGVKEVRCSLSLSRLIVPHLPKQREERVNRKARERALTRESRGAEGEAGEGVAGNEKGSRGKERVKAREERDIHQ